MRTVEGTEGLRELVGQHIGWSEYLEISQDRVNQFAEATGDHQWIHIDPERAAKESPFGGPIAHGYLTLSLLPMFLPTMWEVHGFSMGLNYGAEKIRFPSPVPVGAKVRCGATVDSVDEIAGGLSVQLTATLECEGAPKPACVATVVYRFYE
jgi:acyl dehydratase